MPLLGEMRISCCRLKSVSLPLLSCSRALPCAGGLLQGPTPAEGHRQQEELSLLSGGWQRGESWRVGRKEQRGEAHPPRAHSPAFTKRLMLHGLLPSISAHLFFLGAFPHTHPLPLQLLHISPTSPNLPYPFYLPQQNRMPVRLSDSFPQALYSHHPPRNLD